jgi:hypothetical protein
MLPASDVTCKVNRSFENGVTGHPFTMHHMRIQVIQVMHEKAPLADLKKRLRFIHTQKMQ